MPTYYFLRSITRLTKHVDYDILYEKLNGDTYDTQSISGNNEHMQFVLLLLSQDLAGEKNDE